MRKTLVLATTLVLVLAACSSGTQEGRSNGTGGGPDDPGRSGGSASGEQAGALVAFDDCDQLAEYAAEQAAGWFGGEELAPFDRVGAPVEADEYAAMDTAAGAPVPSTIAGEFSTTNNQEEGVDEADGVKTDGEMVLTTTDGTLRVFDATGAEPRLAGSVELPEGGPHELLLHGDRVLVLSTGSTIIPPGQEQGEREGLVAPSYLPSTVLTEVDISNPDEPVVVSTQQVDGGYRTARSADGTARIVLVSDPYLDGRMPLIADDGSFDDRAAEARSAGDWLPAVTVVDADGEIERSPLVACEDVSRPVDESAIGGAGTVTVLSIDLTEPLGDLQAVSVMGSAEHVYASPDNLYLAGTSWPDDGSEPNTEVHQLALAGDAPATYVASGEVAGAPLNQFAFSEHDGRLRVATTEENWGGDVIVDDWSNDTVFSEGPSSDSAITVLERSGDRLEQIGRVDGMGEGEQIYAVRFMGDTAYVVTFRRTDPLYTVDLSDPAAPQVVGELEIPGYSAYLHPVGDGLLLGVGQDADEDTGQTRGTQVSLFDVSDPANPIRLQQYALPSGTSDIEYDHRAFLWWGPENLAVVPHDGYDRGWSFNAAVALEVSPDGVAERGRITHEDQRGARPSVPPPPPECGQEFDCAFPTDVVASGASGRIVRSLVVAGDELWTVSDLGVEVDDLDTLTQEAWLPFP